jgi:hypothetical protein
MAVSFSSYVENKSGNFVMVIQQSASLSNDDDASSAMF